jgi:hypothetical protein
LHGPLLTEAYVVTLNGLSIALEAGLEKL